MWKAVNEFNALLEPQERFDRMLSHAFRRHGASVADLSYANYYDGPQRPVLEALKRAIADERTLALQYTPHGGRITTRRQVAASMERDYGLPFHYRDVILTPGATAALNIALRTLFSAEDEVVVPTPCWYDYPVYLANLGIRMRPVPLREDKRLDLEAIAQAIGSRTRGILLSQPCCPTGVVYEKAELEEMAKILAEGEARFQSEIFLLSDEVHRHILWGDHPFHSPLLSYPRSLTIYSFGKALSMQGQRIGYVAVSPRMAENEAVRKQLERTARVLGFCAPTTLMQRAISDLLDFRPPLDLIARRQREARRELKRFGYQVCDADATCFLYVKSPLANDFEFAELLSSRGVLVLPSTLFHEPGYFRLALTAREQAIAAGVQLLGDVV